MSDDLTPQPQVVTPAAPTQAQTPDPAFSDQVVANVVTDAAQAATLQSQGLGTTRRGAATTESMPRVPAPEANQSAGATTEAAPAKELEPEVEKFIEQVEQKQVNAPTEVVLADNRTNTDNLPKTTAQPVVVLPLTEESFDKASKQKPNTSIRWLYEWCVRQIRKLGEHLGTLVVYRAKND